MKILVIGRNPMGHNTVARAGRFWGTTPKLVEVVDVKAGDYIKTVDRRGDKLDEPVPCIEGDDPPPVEVEVKNTTTGRMDKRLVPDPERIGRMALAELERDDRITIKQTDTVSQDASDAAVGAARAEVMRQATEILELKARVAELEAGKDLKEALAENAELKAMLEAQTSPKTKGKAKEAA